MDSVYTVVQIFCVIGILCTSLILDYAYYIASLIQVASVINIFVIIFNIEYKYLKYAISSSIIILGSIKLGDYYIEKNEVLDLSYTKYELVPLLAVIMDIFHVNYNLEKKWIFPIRMDLSRFIIVLILYILNLATITLYYFNLDYTYIDHTWFSFILSLLVIKISFLIYGRYVKTEIIDDEVQWCFKKYPRVNFKRLDQDSDTEIYIGSALNSPIIKETFDILLLSSIGFFYGTNTRNADIFLLLCILSVSKIIIGKNRV